MIRAAPRSAPHRAASRRIAPLCPATPRNASHRLFLAVPRPGFAPDTGRLGVHLRCAPHRDATHRDAARRTASPRNAAHRIALVLPMPRPLRPSWDGQLSTTCRSAPLRITPCCHALPRVATHRHATRRPCRKPQGLSGCFGIHCRNAALHHARLCHAALCSAPRHNASPRDATQRNAS